MDFFYNGLFYKPFFILTTDKKSVEIETAINLEEEKGKFETEWDQENENFNRMEEEGKVKF